MFCKTSDGAEVTGKLFSIIQTARANGIKTELYMKYVIENIGKEDINNLLPWSENIVKKLRYKNYSATPIWEPGNFLLSSDKIWFPI